MEGALKLIFDIVIWIFVPVIILTVLYFARATVKKPGYTNDASAIKSGFWAGFVLFLIVLVYKVGQFLTSGFPHNPIYQGFDIWITFGAALVVLFLFSIHRRLSSSRTIGLLIMLISFLGFYAFVDYLFIRDYNQVLLSLTLGVAFGALMSFASSSGSIKAFLGKGTE